MPRPRPSFPLFPYTTLFRSERYRDPIFRFAYRLLGSVEAAEDVTHDCFLSLIKDPGRFDSSRASLRTYIYARSEEHTSELQSPDHLVCRLLLEKKKHQQHGA